MFTCIKTQELILIFWSLGCFFFFSNQPQALITTLILEAPSYTHTHIPYKKRFVSSSNDYTWSRVNGANDNVTKSKRRLINYRKQSFSTTRNGIVIVVTTVTWNHVVYTYVTRHTYTHIQQRRRDRQRQIVSDIEVRWYFVITYRRRKFFFFINIKKIVPLANV